jgi:serine phosphatase RsbU (regulator of sigma subunit)
MLTGMRVSRWSGWTKRPQGFKYYRTLSIGRLLPLFLAVFCLFSVVGAFNDLVNLGRFPYLLLFVAALASGFVAVVYVLIAVRYPPYWFIIVSLAQIPYWYFFSWFADFLYHRLQLREAPESQGIRVAAGLILFLVVASYSLFLGFIRRQGAEVYRIANELALAHGIQQTLVPPIALITSRFEIYGISCPSEKVGGDLVDALRLPSGDAIAYLADIAGHGLQAGILMGMLKTAVHTAVLDAGRRESSQTLPVLLDRLNSVLPAVKEAHMYATFTGFRLGDDGSVHYAMAASPPILHWHASNAALSYFEEEQFPLGLLPVSGFDGQRLETAPGDLLVVATDGILEVCDKSQEEFGLARLKDVIEGHAKAPLFELAKKILEAANGFGKQADDQTILIVRCL